MKLREIAHCRSGDKGNTANISVIAYEAKTYPFLVRNLTAERVAEHFGDLVKGDVVRYELPRLGALNFVMTEALDGGVVRSLAMDSHGKALSSALLVIDLPDHEEGQPA